MNQHKPITKVPIVRPNTTCKTSTIVFYYTLHHVSAAQIINMFPFVYPTYNLCWLIWATETCFTV